MRLETRFRRAAPMRCSPAIGLLAILVAGAAVRAQESTAADDAASSPPQAIDTPTPQNPNPQPPRPRTAGMEIYGFAMLDMGYDFKQVNPDWYDVLRPTKLPAFPDEFGQNGNFWAGVRQSRFGVKGWLPTDLGEIKTIFEFELFGTGVDAGQTTFRLRHAWGELGQFGAGQTWSPFMDPDVFPNSIEYWGPNGMVFFRNVQARWMPMQGENELFLALERPGASGDTGRLSDRIELQNVKAHFPAPDFSIHYKRSGDWGHVQLAGIVRYIGWTDTLQDDFDLSGHAVGWGVNLSTNVKTPGKGIVRASITYGEGIENYMNDAPVDVGLQSNLAEGNPHRPVVGKALPVLGAVGFYDWYWNDHFSTAVGYSYLHIDNSNLQEAIAFHSGQYALGNVLWYPVKGAMAGLEFQWGRRENFLDGFSVDDYRVQFSAKYNFSFTLGGK
jgi:DcaP outer membrane protein